MAAFARSPGGIPKSHIGRLEVVLVGIGVLVNATLFKTEVAIAMVLVPWQGDVRALEVWTGCK